MAWQTDRSCRRVRQRQRNRGDAGDEHHIAMLLVAVQQRNQISADTPLRVEMGEQNQRALRVVPQGRRLQLVIKRSRTGPADTGSGIRGWKRVLWGWSIGL